ncbi:methyltransferase domain-containing protein [Pseudomonas sp.]|uniref:methyltransferase domain-containing protein n=1 Tax=Pseudomonas sp. TaxID=306 RepID=UPI002635787C|nr:methyltransferase domain-containing protein [Pseudomonas sp.]
MIWFDELTGFLKLARSIESYNFDLEQKLARIPAVAGFCDRCQAVKILKNTVESGNWINARGEFSCEHCGFSARHRLFWRAVSEAVSEMPALKRGMIFEGVTSFGRAIEKDHPWLERCEYVAGAEPGTYHTIRGTRVMHQNMLSLAFPDSDMDILLHQDVLEHVHDADIALRELHRVLRPEGITLFSVPFFHNLELSQRRARLVNGSIEHLLPPAYHGDPLSPEGILVVESFGQDFLNRCAAAGFSRCQLGLDYDIARGFLSDGNPYENWRMLPMLFRLTK